MFDFIVVLGSFIDIVYSEVVDGSDKEPKKKVSTTQSINDNLIVLIMKMLIFLQRDPE